MGGVGGVGGGPKGPIARLVATGAECVNSGTNQSGWPYPAFPKNPRTTGRRVALSRCSFRGE